MNVTPGLLSYRVLRRRLRNNLSYCFCGDHGSVATGRPLKV
jgi:hypothetical protein